MLYHSKKKKKCVSFQEVIKYIICIHKTYKFCTYKVETWKTTSIHYLCLYELLLLLHKKLKCISYYNSNSINHNELNGSYIYHQPILLSHKMCRKCVLTLFKIFIQVYQYNFFFLPKTYFYNILNCAIRLLYLYNTLQIMSLLWLIII